MIRLFKGWDVRLSSLRLGEDVLIPSTEFVQYRAGGSFEVSGFVPALVDDGMLWMDSERRFVVTLREDGVIMRRVL